jgi:hypothetical protein
MPRKRGRGGAARAFRRGIVVAWKRGWTVLVGIAVVACVVGGCLTVRPRLYVWSNDALSGGDTLSVPFVLRNEGYIAMHSVSFDCRVARARVAHGRQISNHPGGSSDASIPTIGGGGSATVPCVLRSLGGGKVIEADVEVIVTYRHALAPWGTEERFRFGGSGAAEGRLRLYARTNSR